MDDQLYTRNPITGNFEPVSTTAPAESPEGDSPRGESRVVDDAPAPVEDQAQDQAHTELLDADGGSPLVRVRRVEGDDTEIIAGRVSVREDGCLVFAAASTGEEG